MADVYGTNFNNEYVLAQRQRVASNRLGGERRVVVDTYEASSAAAGTDVLVGKLWDETLIHDFRILCDALGAGVTLQLVVRNKAGTETAVSTAMDASSAAVLVPVAADIATLPFEVSENVDLVIKIAGGTATGTIKSAVIYCDA